MMGPLGGARHGDPGASTINIIKRRWWALWEVPELDIWEHPSSTVAPWEVLIEI
jgi:hypothetical protein